MSAADDLGVPDDMSTVEREDLNDHVSEIMFDGAFYEPDCLLCQRAKALGLFAAYGVTDEDLDNN